MCYELCIKISVKVEVCAMPHDLLFVVPDDPARVPEVPQSAETLPVGEGRVVQPLGVPLDGHGELDAVQAVEHLDVGLGLEALVDYRRDVLAAVFPGADPEGLDVLDVAGKEPVVVGDSLPERVPEHDVHRRGEAARLDLTHLGQVHLA